MMHFPLPRAGGGLGEGMLPTLLEPRQALPNPSRKREGHR